MQPAQPQQLVHRVVNSSAILGWTTCFDALILSWLVALPYRASTERLTGIAWHPNARPSIHLQQGAHAAAAGSSTVALGTGCADGSAALWSESGKLLRKLEGHTDRLGRVAFHPMGMHFVSVWQCAGCLAAFQSVALHAQLRTHIMHHTSWELPG